MTHPRWTRTEQLLAFRLYCRTPFGRLHRTNPDIVALAEQIGRTPSAVAMKACNFASLDPQHTARGVSGLSNASLADEELWEQFAADAESVMLEAEEAYAAMSANDCTGPSVGDADHNEGTEFELPSGPSETVRLVRTRRLQRFFRDTVLVSYEGMCAITGLAIPELLNASHIIPWREDEHRRADPRNGLCLNAFHDRAFDQGLIGLDDSLRVIVSPALERVHEPVSFHREQLLALAGRQITAPIRFAPDADAIRWHRENRFREFA